ARCTRYAAAAPPPGQGSAGPALPPAPAPAPAAPHSARSTPPIAAATAGAPLFRYRPAPSFPPPAAGSASATHHGAAAIPQTLAPLTPATSPARATAAAPESSDAA